MARKKEDNKEHKKPWQETYAGVQEIQRLSRHNTQYETPNLERELIDQYFRRPTEREPCEELPVSVVLQIVGANITQKLSTVMLGRAFVGLGFRFRTVRGYRHYQVVRRSADEMRVMRHRLPGGDGEDGGDDS